MEITLADRGLMIKRNSTLAMLFGGTAADRKYYLSPHGPTYHVIAWNRVHYPYPTHYVWHHSITTFHHMALYKYM